MAQLYQSSTTASPDTVRCPHHGCEVETRLCSRRDQNLFDCQEQVLRPGYVFIIESDVLRSPCENCDLTWKVLEYPQIMLVSLFPILLTSMVAIRDPR